jgi:hypothetical protein
MGKRKPESKSDDRSREGGGLAFLDDVVFKNSYVEP